MGEIKDKLELVGEIISKKFKSEGLVQLEHAGEAIESELNDLVERINKELRERDSKIRGLEKDISDLFKMLAQRTQCIKALESKCGDIGWFMGQVKSNLRSIDALEKFEKQIEALIDLESFREWLQSLGIKKPTSIKDEPFQVGDTIANDQGDKRIVLKVNPDNSMELMSVPFGVEYMTFDIEIFTLVYRPGPPKPISTVKEPVPTDKDGKPEGGLRPGDVISFHSPDDIKHQRPKRYGSYSYNLHSLHPWEIYAYMFNPGSVDLESLHRDFVTFEFRPKLPEEV